MSNNRQNSNHMNASASMNASAQAQANALANANARTQANAPVLALPKGIDANVGAKLDANFSKTAENKTNCRSIQEPELGGNWQRLKYDTGNYRRELLQSVRPQEFMLDPTNIHRCNPCRPNDIGSISKFGVSYNSKMPLVDTESELKNITRKATRDPNFKYLPNCKTCGKNTDRCGNADSFDGLPCSCDNVDLFHFPSCGMNREFTRISNPTCTLRETGINRFQPTYLDHQDPTRWEHPGETNINYRLVAKDNHVPCLPVLIDQTPALPRSYPIPCQKIVPMCANPIEPLHSFYKGGHPPF